MTTNDSQTGIYALFASRTLAELLRVFSVDPDREYYQRELQRATGAHLRQLQRDLDRLERSGLVSKRASGNRSYYRAQRFHPAFSDVRSAILKTLGLGDILREALSEHAGISVAFVFGSLARGDAAATSDVDLLVIGSVSRRNLAETLARVSERLAREVNLMLMTPRDFAQKRRGKDHFVTAVLAEPRIWVIGDERTLAAVG